jgi:NitT/TauT family transport system substrate-binding protein
LRFLMRARLADVVRRRLSLVLALVFVASVTACASGAAPAATSSASAKASAAAATPSAAPVPVSLRLDWLPGWYHSAFHIALNRGYYKEAGIDLTIVDGNGSNTTGTVVAAGSDTFGLMSLPAMITLVDKGAKLQSIGTYIQRVPETVISLSTTNIKTPKDLEGKRWGYTAGSSGENLFPIFAAKTGIDVNKITKVNLAASAKLQALLLGQIDFVTDWSANVDPVIIAAGKTPAGIAYADNGVNVLGHTLVATPATITGKPELVKGFLAATVKGINAAMAEPDAAVAALIQNRPAMADQKASLVEAVKNLKNYVHTKASTGKAIGFTEAEDVAATLAAMTQYFALASAPKAETLYTNDLLPKP